MSNTQLREAIIGSIVAEYDEDAKSVTAILQEKVADMREARVDRRLARLEKASEKLSEAKKLKADPAIIKALKEYVEDVRKGSSPV